MFSVLRFSPQDSVDIVTSLIGVCIGSCIHHRLSRKNSLIILHHGQDVLPGRRQDGMNDNARAIEIPPVQRPVGSFLGLPDSGQSTAGRRQADDRCGKPPRPDWPEHGATAVTTRRGSTIRTYLQCACPLPRCVMVWAPCASATKWYQRLPWPRDTSLTSMPGRIPVKSATTNAASTVCGARQRPRGLNFRQAHQTGGMM